MFMVETLLLLAIAFILIAATITIVAIIVKDARKDREREQVIHEARLAAKLPDLMDRFNKALSDAENTPDKKIAVALVNANSALINARKTPLDRVTIYVARAAVEDLEQRVEKQKN